MLFLDDVKKWAESYCAQLLDSYINQISLRNGPFLGREFNDPIWNTVSATAFECIIIDSPLFQNLRRIRQLGVVHWIYPGALHSRFEHSLGVLHQVEQIAESINRSARREANEQEALSREDKATLRFAALCHDLGHGTMSHVVEYAVSGFDDVENLLLEFSDANDIEKVSLSEMMAHFILGSSSFKHLFQIAKSKSGGDAPPENAIETSQLMIIGKIVRHDKPQLHCLISGPFDADKLDYMQRDALMCGVPAITDVPRLIGKIRSRWVSVDQLPSSISHSVIAGHERYLIFGLAFSGSRTLDELLIARVLLFDKIYRHQKVRALEGMIARLYEAMAKVYDRPIFQLLYEFPDDVLLNADKYLMLHEGFTVSDSPFVTVIGEICARLRNRCLYERAFAFSLHFKEFPPGSPETEQMALFKSRAEGSGRNAFVKAIADEIIIVLEALGMRNVKDTLADKSLISYLWIDPPTASDHSKKVAHACLFKDHEIVPYSEHSTEVAHWSQGYLSKKDVGYVFTVPELRNAAFLAIEKILASKEYGVKMPKSSFVYLKFRPDELSTQRERLRQHGYYANIPFLTRPRPPRLLKGDIKSTYHKVLTNLRGYEGPNGMLSESIVEIWLSQYENDAEINVALDVVSAIKQLGRKDFVEGLQTFVTANATFSNSTVCPLGDPKDSGAVVAYSAKDLGIEVMTLAAALEAQKPIILVDNFIGSGSQSIKIVADWLEVAVDIDLQEKKREPLDQRGKDSLRSLPIAFVFAGGWSIGQERLLEKCREWRLNAFCYIHIVDDKLPSLFDERFQRLDGYNDFKRRCEKVAESTLTAIHPSWGKEKLKSRLLGYGNKGLLVTTTNNTPSQSLTALWQGGIFNGCDWTPLLMRLPKT